MGTKTERPEILDELCDRIAVGDSRGISWAKLSPKEGVWPGDAYRGAIQYLKSGQEDKVALVFDLGDDERVRNLSKEKEDEYLIPTDRKGIIEQDLTVFCLQRIDYPTTDENIIAVQPEIGFSASYSRKMLQIMADTYDQEFLLVVNNEEMGIIKPNKSKVESTRINPDKENPVPLILQEKTTNEVEEVLKQ